MLEVGLIIHSSIHLSIHSSIHQFIHSAIHPLTQPLIHQSTHPCINPPIRPLIHQSTLKPTHKHTHLFNHPSHATRSIYFLERGLLDCSSFYVDKTSATNLRKQRTDSQWQICRRRNSRTLPTHFSSSCRKTGPHPSAVVLLIAYLFATQHTSSLYKLGIKESASCNQQLIIIIPYSSYSCLEGCDKRAQHTDCSLLSYI